MTSIYHLMPRRSFFQSLAQSQFTYRVNRELLQSISFSVINPRGHTAATDCTWQDLPASAIAGLNDESVLAVFTSGFFGGFVFGPERLILSMGLGKLFASRFSSFEPDPSAIEVWNTSEIPRTHLLPKGSSFFGAFKLLDKHTSESPEQGPSYVDYAFGTDGSKFAGCHRFQISRFSNAGAPDRTEDGIRIELQGFRCNPQENIPSAAEYLAYFHLIYAKVLFANGIQSLLAF